MMNFLNKEIVNRVMISMQNIVQIAELELEILITKKKKI